MSTTATTPDIPDRRKTRTVGLVRTIADVAQRWLAVVGVALCALQIALAGLGYWTEVRTGVSEAAGRAAFAPHALNGQVLQWLAVALLVAGVIARANLRSWLIPLMLAILLWVVQGLLVGLGFGVSPAFGLLHALDGTLITAGLVWLAYDRWQHPIGRTSARIS